MEKAEKVQPAGTLFTIAMNVLRSSGAPHRMPMQSWISTGSSISPSAASCCANQRWPVSNASISGLTPSAVICRAISRSIEGVLVMT